MLPGKLALAKAVDFFPLSSCRGWIEVSSG